MCFIAVLCFSDICRTYWALLPDSAAHRRHCCRPVMLGSVAGHVSGRGTVGPHRRRAGPRRLDTYTAERHPIGEWILRNSSLWSTAPRSTTSPTRRTRWSAGSCQTWTPPPGTSSPCPLRRGRAVLLDLADSAEIRSVADTSCADLAGLVIRPDGYVAWASATAAPEGLPDALTCPGSGCPPRQRQLLPYTTSPICTAAADPGRARSGGRRALPR
jgi:hypothetical protein